MSVTSCLHFAVLATSATIDESPAQTLARNPALGRLALGRFLGIAIRFLVFPESAAKAGKGSNVSSP
jgi:hypothetical protein